MNQGSLDRRPTGLHPITPPANMRRETTLVTNDSSLSATSCPDEIIDPNRPPRNLVLCFDGTGNLYKGDGTETNVLKIFGFLNRDAAHQYHYYQPGIGTYAVRSTLGETDWLTRARGEVEKGLDLMFGTSLANHVLGGYKFLMRYYAPGDNVYIFGFSRGAYTARFLAEMLDDVGLLPHGNEEMLNFAWQTFTEWQCREPFDGPKPTDTWKLNGKKETLIEKRNRKKYNKQKGLGQKLVGFRKKFSRHFDPIRFLGLFDTVNSVPQYENAWLGRASGKKAFPYSARSSAREIWHAVSIDERRVKFRPDLAGLAIEAVKKDPNRFAGKTARERAAVAEVARSLAATPQAVRHLSPVTSPISPQELDRIMHDPKFGQTVHEVWFGGNHCDVGGGYADPQDGALNMADVPLVWMIRAAMKAGVLFDFDQTNSEDESSYWKKLKEAILRPDKPSAVPATTTNGSITTTSRKSTIETHAVGGVNEKTMHERYLAMLKGTHHDVLKMDRLKYGWMEYLPFKRMDLDPSTSRWKPIRWPPSRGDTRDVPDEVPVKVHASVIERMKVNPSYRPRNLILGGGRGGKNPLFYFWRKLPAAEFNPDHWVPVEDDPYLAAIGDDEFGAVYRKLTKEEIAALEKNKEKSEVAVKETEVMGEKNGEVMEKKTTRTSVTAVNGN
ncbi:short chain dehydrogenase [Rhypophila decipiens]